MPVDFCAVRRPAGSLPLVKCDSLRGDGWTGVSLAWYVPTPELLNRTVISTCQWRQERKREYLVCASEVGDQRHVFFVFYNINSPSGDFVQSVGPVVVHHDPLLCLGADGRISKEGRAGWGGLGEKSISNRPLPCSHMLAPLATKRPSPFFCFFFSPIARCAHFSNVGIPVAGCGRKPGGCWLGSCRTAKTCNDAIRGHMSLRQLGIGGSASGSVPTRKPPTSGRRQSVCLSTRSLMAC